MPVLALDIGGTKLAAGVITPGGEPLAVRFAATGQSWSPAQVVETQYAEIGIDVDKPSDFDLVQAELAKRRLG